MTKKISVPYFEKYKHEIHKQLKIYKKKDFDYDNNLFKETVNPILNLIESGITRHRLRYYQIEALYLLDYIYRLYQSEKHKKGIPEYKALSLIKDLTEKIDNNTEVPFIGYEMATGSGKTMLMGACIYYLNKAFNIDNFLIIAPSSLDIYQKTIRNFKVGDYDSIWAEDTPFKFNLVTGDDYKEHHLFHDENEPNIFVFNIDKFGSNATNTEKQFESSIWKDEEGNTVSIKKYLQNKKLAIITDEAHHTQGRTSLNIIKKFTPEIVLEFTATASESQKDIEKREQTVIYKYDIKKYLEDGYGKLVKAVALINPEKEKIKDELPQFEKLKIITLFFIHLLKKESILLDPKSKVLKPLSFVKVKNDTPYAQKVFDYIINDLSDDVENIKIILEKIKTQTLEITDLIKNEVIDKKYKKIDDLKKALKELSFTVIFYHGKSDKETQFKFDNLRKNEIEIIVYMQKLDEGIDFPNIYSIAVINDNVSDFLTSVKQIIGRGVRLPKDKREFDERGEKLIAQSEKLHIVCDQGKNFEDVILAIQKEFGLTDKYLSIDKERVKVVNKVKSELLDGKYIPKIEAGFIVKPSVTLYNLVSDTDKIVNSYIEHNCFKDVNDTKKIKRFIKYMPDSFFIEVDVFSDSNKYKKEMLNAGGKPDSLKLSDKEINAIFEMLLKNLYLFPNTQKYFNEFKKYIKKLNEIELMYYKIDEGDKNIALNSFINTFVFFYKNHIEKNYYNLDYKFSTQDFENTGWSLKKNFDSYEMIIPQDQKENKALKNKDEEKLKDLIKNNYYFYGYKTSIYDYVSFDSYTEKQLADYLERALIDNKINFWIKNQRNIYFTYGNKRYFPDFIVYKSDILYVIETKGEIYSDFQKNYLLNKLNDINGYKSLLIYSDFFNKNDVSRMHWTDFITSVESSISKLQSNEKLIASVPDNEKYYNYIPAYSLEKAYKRFIIQNEKITMDGWLKLETSLNYPKSTFAVQVKGDKLFPSCSNNEWIILDSVYDDNKLEGKIALIRYDELKDEDYPDKYTIRKIKTEIKKEGLFFRNIIRLEGIEQNIESIIIQDFDKGEVYIVGVMV